MTDTLSLLSAALADRYLLERELGRGGMAVVYLARDLKHDRPVALKVLHPELAATLAQERFLQEIRIAARLQHPHIVPVHDSGSDGGLLWYTMPFVDGESLRHRLDRDGQLSPEAALRLAREVAAALDYAHRQGVVHRDVKPENILLKDGHAVVADFGISRALGLAGSERLTRAGLVLGTPAYMSPEQLLGSLDLDGRSDQYSLACMVYEMLSGRSLHLGATPQAIMAERFRSDGPDLRLLPEGAPKDVLTKALAQEPSGRFESVADFARALTSGTGGATVVTAEPRRVAARRAPVRAGTALLAAALGAAALIVQHKDDGDGGSSAPARSLVVLPFKNVGPAEEAYFTQGLTEEITNRLASASALAVISRTSADQYKDSDKPLKRIAGELGVDYVLEGTVRWDTTGGGAKRIRATTRLVLASEDRPIWVNRYDAALTSVFDLQTDIAEQVTAALDLALRGSEREALARAPTRNLDAYQFYLRGKAFFARGHAEEDLRKSVEQFEQAVAKDPGFALAYAALSRAHDLLYWNYYDRTQRRVELARSAAETALRLQPELAEAHLAMGYHYYHGRMDYGRAHEVFTAAHRLQPNLSETLASLAYVQRRLGRWRDVIANLERALRLDPRSVTYCEELAMTHLLLGQYAHAERYADRAIGLGSWSGPYVLKANIALLRKRPAEHARVLRDALANHPLPEMLLASRRYGFLGDYILLVDPGYRAKLRSITPEQLGGDTLEYLMFRAGLHRYLGDKRIARAYYDSSRVRLEAEVREKPEDDAFHMGLGLVYSQLGQKEDAVREARRALEILPLSKDAFNGMDMVAGLAEVYVNVGDFDAAREQLGQLFATPCEVWKQVVEVAPWFEPVRRQAVGIT